ncbi:MAG TPA: hypothetical protein VGU67_05115 [Edaphobacter sp.]|nr:hypothetical protein [Edaphobacter sp.]
MTNAESSAGEVIALYMKNVQQHLVIARKRVYNSNLSGAELQRAQGELRSLLTTKDYFLCMMKILYSPEMRPINGPANPMAFFYTAIYKRSSRFDGGIPTIAVDRFDEWARHVAEHLGDPRSATYFFQVIPKFQDALKSDPEDYERYSIARDWGETAAAGRNITTDPKLYADYLILIDGPEGNFWPLGRQPDFHAALLSTFGQDAVDRSLREVMSARKNRDGLLIAMPTANDNSPERPLHVLLKDLGESGPRGYAITQLLLSADLTPGGLQAVAQTYSQWVTNDGEPEVIRAVQKVRDAPKNQRGELMDPRLIGASHAETWKAIGDLLPHSLAQSPAALPVKGKGSRASTSVASSETLPAATVDNPVYRAWSHFPISTAAVLALDDSFSPRKDLHIARLQSMDKSGATVLNSEAHVRVDGAEAGANFGPETVQARIVAPPTSTESGKETLRVNGKTYDCSWQKTGNYILWMNDEVPGGVVVEKNNNYFVYQAQIKDPDMVRSLSDLQFSVESLSDGPYKRDHVTTAGSATSSSGGSQLSGNTPSHPTVNTFAARQAFIRPGTPYVITVRTVDVINRENANSGRPFRARLDREVLLRNAQLPAGAAVYLHVVLQQRRGSSALIFDIYKLSVDHLVINGAVFPVSSNAVQMTRHEGSTGLLRQQGDASAIRPDTEMSFQCRSTSSE